MKKKILVIILIIIFLILGINIILNNLIATTRYTIQNNKINNDLNGYKIVQISDVHSIRNENKKEKIIEKVKKENPNIIFVTGDLVDTDYYSEQNGMYQRGEIKQIEKLTLDFMKELVNIADVYFIYGNHELVLLDDPVNNEFVVALNELGIRILNNKLDTIQINNTAINLVGLQDPSILYKDKKYAYMGNNKEKTKSILDDLIKNNNDFNNENFTILLAHRPEFFDLYSNYDVDIAFTGHTHGGLIRLPIIRGVYSRAEGIFPKYSVGEYNKENITMIINSGIGYSEIPIRIFNTPEIVVTTLSKWEINYD